MLVYDQYVFDEQLNFDDDIVVFHSGFASTSPNYSYGKDTRDYYLIHYVIKGKGSYQIGKQIHYLKKNDGFLITPGQTIVHTADASDPWTLVFIAFYGKKVPELLQSCGLDKNHLLFHYNKDDYLENCIKNIYNETRSTKNLPRIIGNFYLFLAALVDMKNGVTTNAENHTSFHRFDDALIYIRRNIYSKISVQDLANYLRLNTSQVYRIFKKNMNQSPQQVITKMRMEKARELLQQTDLSITEIATWLDYDYPSHFTKQFRDVYGISPSDFRK